MRRLHPVPLALAAALSAAPPLAAQDFMLGPVFDMGALTNSLSMSGVIQHEERRAAQLRNQPGPRAAAQAGLVGAAMAAAPPAQLPSLRYTPTPALALATVEGMAGRLQAGDPRAAAALQEALRGQDYRAIWRRLIGTSGFRDNDAVDAVAAYLILGWLIANGITDPPDDPAGTQAVRRQLAAPLAANPALADPATRAALGEETKLLFVVLHAGWQSAAREGRLAAYAQGAARIFQSFGGQDPRRLVITAAGFRPR